MAVRQPANPRHHPRHHWAVEGWVGVMVAHFYRLFLLIVLQCVFVGSAFASPQAELLNDDDLKRFKKLLYTPEFEVDFAEAKIALDQMVEPQTNAEKIHQELNDWLKIIQSRLPDNASRQQKMDTLLSTLYVAGSWNDQKPFKYDFNDPSGTNFKNKLLQNYLETRLGNCVFMPALVLILGQKLNLPVTLSTAPNHILVKYLDENNQWQNIEATAGGFKFDTEYERELEITELAIKNQLYLRPHSRQESVGIMAFLVMEHLRARHELNRLLAMADIILARNPKQVTTMLHKGNAYYWLLENQCKKPYPNLNDIPPEKMNQCLHFSQQNIAWFEKAEALGWVQPSADFEAKYERSLKQHQAKQQGAKP